MEAIHQQLAEGKWFELSLLQQLANIGSEVGRAAKWENKNEKIYQSAVLRAFELLELTISDKKNKERLRELTRAKEMFGAAYLNDSVYHENWKGLEKYFSNFAVASQLKSGK